MLVTYAGAVWGCDHYKTTLNANQLKQFCKKRTAGAPTTSFRPEVSLA